MMDDKDVRLECLKMASESGCVFSDIERTAKRFYDFVMGKEPRLSVVETSHNQN